MLRSITNASGTQAELVVVDVMTHLRDSNPSLPTFDVAPTEPWPLLPSLAQPFPPFFHMFISPHFTVSFLTLLTIRHSGALLKDVPNLRTQIWNRISLTWCGWLEGPARCKMGCGNPRRSPRSSVRACWKAFWKRRCWNWVWNNEQIYLKAEGRVMQWASIASQAPWHVCSQSHSSPDPQQ